MLIGIVFSFLFLITPVFSYNYKVAVVTGKNIKPYQNALKGFKKICINSHYSYHYLKNKRKEEIIIALKYEKPDLILAIGSSALEIVESKIKDIPIVFCMVLNPDVMFKDDAVENISGVSMNVSPEAQIMTLKEIFPKIKRIGAVYNPEQTEYLISETKKVCNREGLEFITSAVYSQEEIINAVKKLEDKIDVFWMVPDTTTITPLSVKYMLLFSFRNEIPLLGISDKYVKKGALLALSFDAIDIGRQAGELALRILKEKNPKSSFLIFARALKLFINLKTAKTMGLDIPEEMKERADKIYR